MLKEIESKPRRIVGTIFFILSAISMLIRIVICGVIFSRLNPWYFHGKVVAMGYIIATLVCMIIGILGLILYIVKGVVNFKSLDGIANCCNRCFMILQCIFDSGLFKCCCCNSCFEEPFSWISWLIGWVVFAFGVINVNRELNEIGICSGQYYDLLGGITKYLIKNPDKIEKFKKWWSKYSLDKVCDVLDPFLAILIIEFICQMGFAISKGLCCCCCSKRVSNNQNVANNSESQTRIDNQSTSMSIDNPNYNNDDPNEQKNDNPNNNNDN